MDFGLSAEISDDADKNSDVITRVSKYFEGYFEKRYYGEGIETFVIGIICVRPEVDFFFEERRVKYSKKKRELTYDIKLDYQQFVDSNEKEIIKLLSEKIVDSLKKIEGKKIPDFDRDQFKNDLIICLKEIEQHLPQIQNC